MARRNFAEILKEAGVNIKAEYDRLYEMFYNKPAFIARYTNTLNGLCRERFMDFSFRGTCISLNDFNKYYGFYFEPEPLGFDIDYLISFCEYSYNFVTELKLDETVLFYGASESCNIYINQILSVIESIGYMSVNDEEMGVVIFVPKNAPAIAVAEMLPKDMSYKVIEYNHHSLKRNLKRKSQILKVLADQLEPKEKYLKGINKQYSDDLFCLFNNLNVRHNNEDKIQNISEEELEEWYDYTYDMSLLAFMMLEKKNHKSDIIELKKKLGVVKEG